MSLNETARENPRISPRYGESGGRLVPFVLDEEGGGGFGDHALAILSEIAELGAQTGKLKVPDRVVRGPAPTPRLLPLIGYVSGSTRFLGGSIKSLCLPLFSARHPVPLCKWVLDLSIGP